MDKKIEKTIPIVRDHHIGGLKGPLGTVYRSSDNLYHFIDKKDRCGGCGQYHPADLVCYETTLDDPATDGGKVVDTCRKADEVLGMDAIDWKDPEAVKPDSEEEK